MWIPAQFLALLAAQISIQASASAYNAVHKANPRYQKAIELVPLKQPSDVLYCRHGDKSVSFRPDSIVNAHVQGMKLYYKNQTEQGYPKRVSRTQLDPEPKWSSDRLQYPMPVNPETHIPSPSPFRVIFTKPEIGFNQKKEKVLFSSFWGLTYLNKPGGKLLLCTVNPL